MTNNLKLINFVRLSDAEKRMVLEWRNHPDVKQWMYTSDDIALDAHLNFIDSLNHRIDKRYFVVKNDEGYLGVIDFYNIAHDSCEFGLYVNPFAHTRGIGKELLTQSILYAFNTLNVQTLVLEVFCNNTKAIHLYEKYGFTPVGKRTLNENEIIIMELTHENRTV